MSFMRVFENPLKAGRLQILSPEEEERELQIDISTGSIEEGQAAARRLVKEYGYRMHVVTENGKKIRLCCKPGAWNATKRRVREMGEGADLVFWAGELGCFRVW